MDKEDLFFEKVEGDIREGMHGCAYENYDCTCKLTEEYRECIYKSNTGKCTYIPPEIEIPHMPKIDEEELGLFVYEDIKILKKIW